MELDPVQLSTHCFVRCSQGAESPTGFNQEDRLSAGRVEHSGGWIVGDRPTGQIPRYRARREEGAALLALGGGLVLPHAGSLDSPTDRTRPTRRSRPRLVGGGQRPYSSSRRSQTSLVVGNDGTACRRRSSGTSPTTATVAECSSSARSGPTKVAPTTTRRSSSTTSLAWPRYPSAVSAAPGTLPTSQLTERTGWPWARAWSSVGPTWQTCGSVKTTCGTQRWSATARNAYPSAGRPAALAAITSAQIRAWYLPMWVSRFRPVTSPQAYSQPPCACRWSSTSTYLPGVSPTESSPRSAVVGLRPSAASTSSASMLVPSRSVTVTGPPAASRRTSLASAPVSTRMSAAPNASASRSEANGSTRPSSRSPRPTRVTSSAPSDRIAWAISQATTPPPSTTSRRGAAAAFVASRLVQGCASASPGIGGMFAIVPTASTTACRAVTVRPPSAVATCTRRSPASRACPRASATPAPSSQRTWLASSWPNWLSSRPTNQSRRANTAPASSGPVTAPATPGNRRAAAYSSIGRSSALLGTQAQNEHSPPTSSCSTSSADSPAAATRPATFSPGGPPPITTTS